MAKRRPNEQREQKPNLFGLCRVANEEEEFKPKYQPFRRWELIEPTFILQDQRSDLKR